MVLLPSLLFLLPFLPGGATGGTDKEELAGTHSSPSQGGRVRWKKGKGGGGGEGEWGLTKSSRMYMYVRDGIHSEVISVYLIVFSF